MTDLSRTVDELADIAVELAIRVRDDNPEANGRWLRAVLPDPNDWFRLAFVLAAAVPDDRPWLQLTAWTIAPAAVARGVRIAPEHGTYAGAQHHRRNAEKLCPDCLEAERAYKRENRAVRAMLGRAA